MPTENIDNGGRRSNQRPPQKVSMRGMTLGYRRKKWFFDTMLADFAKTICGFIESRVFLIGLLTMIAVVFHMVIVEEIYMFAFDPGQVKKNRPTEKPPQITFKVEPVKSQPPTEIKKPVAKPKTSVSKRKIKPKRSRVRPKPLTPKLRTLPATKLEALGKNYLPLRKEGRFPSLTIDYNDPEIYIREVYRIGAKTAVYDPQGKDMYEIKLFDGSLIPMTPIDLENFSSIKRVIKDTVWDYRKEQAAALMDVPAVTIQLILLLPLVIELRWTGHIVSIIDQLKIYLAQVAAVDARLHRSKFKLTQIHLKDGTSRRIKDPGST